MVLNEKYVWVKFSDGENIRKDFFDVDVNTTNEKKNYKWRVMFIICSGLPFYINEFALIVDVKLK